MIARGLGIGALAAMAYAFLGNAVAHRPPQPLWPIDVAGTVLGGHATHLALIFTASCWWPSLTALGLAVAALGIAAPAWRTRAVFSIVVTLVGWRVSDVLKDAFARPRPNAWFLHHETSFGYSSGHAMFAVVVYGLWSYLVATSAFPRSLRATLAGALALWAGGVIWSRLALGAHWVTDLIGGVLLGVALLGIGAAIAGAWPQRAQSPASSARAAGRGPASSVT
jgi:undecaprenyl-diphosphatase